MTIDNQCSNIKLVSPVYFAKDGVCHVQFPQHVYPKCMKKVDFITGVDSITFGGALLYHLQRKEDASISTQLLVIWTFGFVVPYPHVWLIEHESTLTWNEDKLKRLYDVYNERYDKDFNTGKWLLYDNTKLQIVRESSRGGFKANVTISEEKGQLQLRKPLWIDSNR
jgi:hypothetical protein